MSIEGILGLLCIWCVVNTILIFVRSSNNDTKKTTEEIKDLKNQHNKLANVISPLSNFCLSYFAEQELKFEMYKLKQEGYDFPFDKYDFDSWEFNKISQTYFDLKDKLFHTYEEFPYELFIKDVFLPNIKYDYPEDIVINDLKTFIRNNADKIKAKQ